jgi:ABC-2 type transport system permease protein
MTKQKRYGKFAVYIAAIVLINLVAATLFFRLDLTSNKVYSLSKVSRNVVSTLKEPLTINVFFTSNLPSPYNTVEQYIKDMLGEYALNANTYFNYRFYDVSAEGEIDAARTEENRKLAQNYGINPVHIQVVEKDEMKFKKAYMGLVLIHGDMVERIPTITSTDGLEYKLTTTIQRLNNKISALLNLKDKVKVRLYISPSLQGVAPQMGIKDLPKVSSDIKKVVDDLNARMYGKLDYAFSEPADEAEMTHLSKSYNLMTLKWPVLEGGRVPAGSGVIGLVTEYGSKSFMIPVLQAFNIPLFGTQYKLTDTRTIQDAVEQGVESLIGINETLGYLSDKGTLDMYGSPGATASLTSFNNLASKSYSLKDINLKGGIPEGLSCLLIVRPTEQFSDYDLFQIDQALMKGTNLAVFLDPFKEAAPTGSPYQQQGQVVPVNTGLEKLLAHYGVKVNQAYVLDENCFKQRLPEQYGGGEQKIYFAPMIESSQINSRLDFMKNIKELITYKIAPLTLNDEQIKKNKLNPLRLFSSSEKSWEMKDQIVLNPMFIRPPASGEGMASRALAYIIEGSFPSYFAGKPIPEKPAEAAAPHAKDDKQMGDEGAKNPAAGRLEHKGDFLGVSKPAKIFIIGSSEMLTDNLITEQGDNPNSTLIMNIIDVLNNKSDIALMRSKIQSFNPLEVKDEKIKVAAKAFNIAGLPVIVVIFGLFVWLRRHSRKKRIEAAFHG